LASVVYLTDTRYGADSWQHPSARHRCYHYADAWLASSKKAAVITLEQATPNILSQFDHAVFHRPTKSKRLKRALQACMAASVETHADYDDLVFDPTVAEFSPLYLNGNRPLAKVKQEFESNLAVLKLFDNFIVSTNYLKTRLRALHKDARVTVLPNSLPRVFHAPAKSTLLDHAQVIGYFPGSNSHTSDFQSIRESIAPLLTSGVHLLIYGRLHEKAYAGLANVQHIEFADYNRYLSALSKVHVSIAPLNDSPFNRAKSAVKLIESVAVGTPIVASTNPDMADHRHPLAHLVSDESEWAPALIEALSAYKDLPHYRINEYDGRYSVINRLHVLESHLL